MKRGAEHPLDGSPRHDPAIPKGRVMAWIVFSAAVLILTMVRVAGVAAAERAPPTMPAAWTIGVLHLGHTVEAPVVTGLRQGLKDLGYVEGQDVILEIRAARGQYAIALEAARELAKRPVTVIVSAGTVATKAAKEGAGAVPVVFTQVGEPIAAGFAKSLPRPGGNMTGFTHLLVESTSKRLELLKELVPTCRTALVIFDPTNATSARAAVVARDTATKLGIRLHERHISSREEVMKVIETIDKKATDAILVIPDSLVVNSSQQIIERSRRDFVPVMFHEETWVARGGLASYGASFVDIGRQAAQYADRIRKGAQPAELPIQQPTKFDLVVNIKTAKALGLTVPQSILLRATRVIE